MSAPLVAMLSPLQLTVLLFIGILLFGRRLPEMGRSVGKALKEFKAGLAGIEDEIGGVNLHAEPSHSVAGTPPALQAPQRITEPTPRFTEQEHSSDGPLG